MPAFEYCYYVKVKNEYIFIPGCIGGGVKGPDGCTCLGNFERLEMAEKRIERMRESLEALAWMIGQHTGNDYMLSDIESQYGVHKVKQAAIRDITKRFPAAKAVKPSGD